MKILFDSSVLIASFIESHPKHKAALWYLRKAKEKEFEFLVSSHSLLEIYSVLTSTPFNPKITAEIAKQLIDNNIKNLARIVYLTDKEYYQLIEKISVSNYTGGIVYDSLIIQCALKAGADEILTLNIKDFLKLTINEPIKINTV